MALPLGELARERLRGRIPPNEGADKAVRLCLRESGVPLGELPNEVRLRGYSKKRPAPCGTDLLMFKKER